MKKYHRLITYLFVASALLLFGCGDGDNPPPSNSSPAGAPSSVAGSEITINPVINFGVDGSTFDYNNDLATGSGFPEGTASGIFTVTTDYDTGTLFLTLAATTATNSWKSDLRLTLSGFLDVGSDGLIDTFSYEASYDAGSFSGSGEFTGGKPANSNADASSIPDVSGAPTKDEWNKYIVGKNLVAIHSDGDIDYLNISDENHYVDSENSASWPGTYQYSQINGTLGEFKWTETNSDGSLSGYGTAQVTFNDFFSGTYEDIVDVSVDVNGNEHPDSILGRGQFRIFTDVSFLSN